ncbi:LysR family transcriptional regulator [Paenibacillus sp. YPG26]|uniref:LysR family transcriptional regulator n=1 Tax=Paenibacillus sp. YPG26 TaxID=2878915 RepID=UPI0020421587|nr:LysR family transcriptional regulator [Paenibacillus sp. YPG26]USB34065.1 LysR family transcriptional regulator [Paenibacillus sp. YPG26]
MNIVKLKIVVLIEKYKKISDVARMLGLKQPTVTFHMKSLEEELGTAIFDTRRGRVILTEAGRALLYYAQRITSLTDEAVNVVADFDTLERGTLRIGAGLMPGNYYLPVVAGRFMRQFPGIQLDIKIRADNEIVQMLQQADIDLAVMHTIQPYTEENLECEVLEDDEVVLIYPAEHSFTALKKIEVNQIAQERFIQHAEGSFIRDFSERWAAANQVNLWNSAGMDSPEAVKLAVQSRSGISFYTKRGLMSCDTPDGVQTASLPGNTVPGPQITLVYRKDRPIAAAGREFASFLRKI